jgi:chaperonin cofactor prefoldin
MGSCVHNHLVPGRSSRGGNHDEQHGPFVPNDVIPMSDGSVPHRSIFTPIEIVQLDRRVTRLEVVTESISARLDEQKVEFRDFRAEMNARFDKVDDRFEKLDTKVDDRFGKLDTKIDDRFGKLDTKIDDRFVKLDTKIDDRFAKLDEKIEKLGARVNDRFEKLEAKFEDRFVKMEAKFEDRFAKMEAKFEDRFEKLELRFDAKFDRVDARFEEVRISARSDFHLLFGSLIASALGLAGMMAKGFGWF